MDILQQIVEKKKKRLEEYGAELGFAVPAAREVPLVPFIQDPFLVCEIKRKSPSRGDIAASLDAVSQAALYRENSVKSVSVLTEQDYFSGSLEDLMQVKKRFPGLAVLRKDFLLTCEEVAVSYRAGADAVLLIAAILDAPVLAALYEKAKSLGMQPLVEVHSREDIEKVKALKPDLTGINARDLAVFRTDLALPLQVKRWITWETNLLFESGIHSREEARFALSGGFRGILVGEAVVRNPGLIADLQQAFGAERVRFWNRLFSRKPPYVKICGITCREDAIHAAGCGADMLGFVFAASKRRIEPALLHLLADLDVLKVAVVVTEEQVPPGLPAGVKELLAAGLIDAVQLHGAEQPEECYALAFPYYKAVQIGSAEDTGLPGRYRCPRVLVDAFTQDKRGGTGRSIPDNLVQAVREKYPLWLAGGIGPDNIGEILARFSPELVDASSRLESAPGKKDQGKTAFFIKEIKCEQVLQ